MNRKLHLLVTELVKFTTEKISHICLRYALVLGNKNAKWLFGIYG